MTQIRFPIPGQFYAELKKQIEKYFTENKLTKTGNWRMFSKSILIILLLGFAYSNLVFFHHNLFVTLLLIVALAQSFVLVGFNIQHDANHGSYSQNKKINTLLGFTLDFIGGSSWVWRTKHNILHHTYTNLSELDSDMNTNGLMRLSPIQPWRPWHRWQYIYAIPIYSLMSLSWIFYGDIKRFFLTKIHSYQLPKPQLIDIGIFCTSKLTYFGYMVLLPSFFHPLWQVIIAFVLLHFILGTTLALVFQLAHIVDDNDFPEPNVEGHIENEWAIHEIQTTANFANNNKFISWYLGGLNFQIEHHLFTRICHIHYPNIQPYVKEICQKFNIQYISYRTFWQALLAHWRQLKKMAYKPTM
jgi:linoleoyl-CoA desaturase